MVENRILMFDMIFVKPEIGYVIDSKNNFMGFGMENNARLTIAHTVFNKFAFEEMDNDTSLLNYADTYDISVILHKTFFLVVMTQAHVIGAYN